MTELKWITFVTTLGLVFTKIESDDTTKCGTFYSNSKTEIIINEWDINDIFESIYAIITSNLQKSLVKRLRQDYWFSHRS